MDPNLERALAQFPDYKTRTELDLQENQIVDVSPLESLTRLQGLDLNFNQIVDVSPLQSLTHSQIFYLSFKYDNPHLLQLQAGQEGARGG